ncbi:DNA polymerase III subunit alpha [mine drainage metagenome]|uniref:DNA polymerase III subunit alpha n=1 Tax=mine drainage metagenome TaxID=410659 RepID=A0A1J5PXF6_9ZZZZ
MLPPDVNASQWRFDPVDDKTIRYALGAIKGNGQGAVEAMTCARQERPFTSLFDFTARVDRSRTNKRVLEALARAGAFDSLHPERAAVFAAVETAMDYAVQQEAARQQTGLFDLFAADAATGAGDNPAHEPALPAVEPWDLRTKLAAEKTAIGYYLSGHLFDASAEEVRQFARTPLAELVDSREPVLIAGIVSGVRLVQSQRGRIAILTLEDRSGAMEIVIGDSLLESARDCLRDDTLLVLRGKAQTDRFSGGLRFNADAVWTLDEARARLGKSIRLRLNGSSTAEPLTEIARQYASETGLPLLLDIERGGAQVSLRLDRVRLRPDDETLAALRELALEGRVQVVYDGNGRDISRVAA